MDILRMPVGTGCTETCPGYPGRSFFFFPLQGKLLSALTFVSLAATVLQRHKQTAGHPVEALPCPGGKTSHKEVT